MTAVNRYQTQFGKICCLPNDTEFVKALSLGKMYEEDLIVSKIIPFFNNSQKYVILDCNLNISIRCS